MALNILKFSGIADDDVTVYTVPPGKIAKMVLLFDHGDGFNNGSFMSGSISQAGSLYSPTNSFMSRSDSSAAMVLDGTAIARVKQGTNTSTKLSIVPMGDTVGLPYANVYGDTSEFSANDIASYLRGTGQNPINVDERDSVLWTVCKNEFIVTNSVSFELAGNSAYDRYAKYSFLIYEEDL